MKQNRERDDWLNAYQGFKKYLNQCVICQEMGYDPIKIELKEGLYFKKNAMKYFRPLAVNEVGLCAICAQATDQLGYGRTEP